MRLTRLITGLLLGLSALPAAASELVVVASGKFPAAALTDDHVASIFLGKTRELPGIGVVRPIDLPPSSPLHAQFAERALNKTLNELNSYCAVRTFTGKGSPPLVLADERAVKAWLAAHPDTVGYIDRRSVDARVKVLYRVPASAPAD